MFRILLVCTANICRSPAACAFFEHELINRAVQLDSAGTLAIDGNTADPMIQSLMAERGYHELASHRSRALLPSHLSRYDLVLCMERRHVEQVRKLNPLSVGKIMLLGHWNSQNEVSDPIGQSREAYIAALDVMQMYAKQWTTKMIDIGMIA